MNEQQIKELIEEADSNFEQAVRQQKDRVSMYHLGKKKAYQEILEKMTHDN